MDQVDPPRPAAETELTRLLDVMAALRDPLAGCPWDRAQDFATIAPYTIEEAYEVADAIGRKDYGSLRDELGDLLFQMVYHARLAEEDGLFAFAEVAKTISEKMIRRHPHVFGRAEAVTGCSDDHPSGWEDHKQTERAARAESGTLAGVPVSLPALSRAAKLTARAARVGFDWETPEAVLEKLDEEIAELKAELHGGEPARLADEVGDLLFVLANLARKLRLDPEECLRQANSKFSRRFAAMEETIEREGHALRDVGLGRMEAAWQAVKTTESNSR